MPFSSIFFSRLLPLGGACAAVLVQPAPALSASAQQQVEARYAISLMGLPLGHADVTGQLDPSSYRVAINTRLTGFADRSTPRPIGCPSPRPTSAILSIRSAL
jgi:hypothetical protein